MIRQQFANRATAAPCLERPNLWWTLLLYPMLTPSLVTVFSLNIVNIYKSPLTSTMLLLNLDQSGTKDESLKSPGQKELLRICCFSRLM